MKKKISSIFLIIILTLSLASCTAISSSFKDFSAELIGLERIFNVYDDAGNLTMSVTGDNTNIEASDVENVLLIEVDGSRWQHVGSTLIAFENGLENYVEQYRDTLTLDGKDSGSITSIDTAVNDFLSKTSGLSRIIIVKTQTGIPVAVFEGDKVLVEASSLPNTTKVLIDGKRLHIYRADLEVIETSLFDK